MSYRKAELITWSSTFICGVKIIDDQHRELVDMINDMFKHVTGSEKEEHDYLAKIIHKAVKYIRVHFVSEERIMLATKFSGYEEHKKTHDGFIITIIDLINDFMSGKKISLFSFTKFLKDWVFSHIAIMDKDYFEYFRDIATRKPNGRLSITPVDIPKTHKGGLLHEVSRRQCG